MSRKAAKWLLIVLTVLICLSCIFLQWFYHRAQSADFPEKLAYREVDSGKEALFAGKNVLLLVPHEDDDLNVFCGVLDEQYLPDWAREKLEQVLKPHTAPAMSAMEMA